MVYPLERICVHLIRRLDVEETLRTVDYLRYGFKLSTDLVERDGRVFWTDKYLDTPEDRAVMDVTEMGFHRLPFSRAVDCLNQVTSARVDGAQLHLEGAVAQPAAADLGRRRAVADVVSVRPPGPVARAGREFPVHRTGRDRRQPSGLPRGDRPRRAQSARSTSRSPPGTCAWRCTATAR